MPSRNIELARHGLDAFNRRDKAAFLALCDPDLENIPPRNWPESAPTRGAEPVWQFLVEGQESWGGGAYEYGEIVEAGDDKVVAELTGAMEGRASGANVIWGYWQVISFRDGRLMRMEWFADRAEAMHAAGMG